MSYALNKTKFLSKDEATALEATLEKFWDSNPRDTAMLMTLLYTGARPSECLRLTKGDLNYENNTVFLRGLKGSRDREIPLPPRLFKRLSEMAAMWQPKDPIFPIALRTCQHVWHQYRPATARGKGIKSLRHTFAIRLYEKTKDIRLVQMALGHRYMNTTQIYAEYVYNQEELKRLLL